LTEHSKDLKVAMEKVEEMVEEVAVEDQEDHQQHCHHHRMP
jgi:hypothetical protein